MRNYRPGRYGARRYRQCRVRRRILRAGVWRIGPCSTALAPENRSTGVCTACAIGMYTARDYPCDAYGRRLSAVRAVAAVKMRGGTAAPMTAISAPPSLPRGYSAVPGFVGYAVNRAGAVISCRSVGGGVWWFATKWHSVVLRQHHQGYKQVRIRVRGRAARLVLVHRMVLAAFVGPCPRGKEACHNNGKHDDNRINNLRWDTKSANLHDRIKHGHIDRSETRAAKLTPAKVRTIRASTESHAALSRRYKVHWKTISRVRARKCWKRV